mmetsp:Transcript_12750/g.46640  ORF Transcript_12750/g.46640 Transcript_12750/m.46640 type:complete len:467 (+) Transcript_12750:119-1519(+)
MSVPEQRTIESLTEEIRLKTATDDKSPELPWLFCERSQQFLNIAKRLLTRPAELSEHRALSAMEPHSLAKLAQKDADRASVLATGPEQKARAQLRLAEALIVLEKFQDAEEAILNGLQSAPSSEELINLSGELHSMFTMDIDMAEKDGASRNKRRHVDRLDDFDCPLCFKLFHEPITTPCGHTFCRECLQRSADHSNRCPMCRCLLLINANTASVSHVLQNVIKKQFPDEHEERLREAQPSGSRDPETASLPLFVMDIVFPGQKIYLNIFEPRYRLMVRRCMASNRRFGMVGKSDSTGALMERATECEISECEPLPDGRFYLEVVALRVGNVRRTWEQDGYRVGELEWIRPETEFPTRADEMKMLQQLAERSQQTLDAMLAGMRKYFDEYHKRAIEEKIRHSGVRPSVENELAKYSWWLCNLLPLAYGTRAEVIRSKTVKGRLEVAMARMEAIGNSSNTLGKCTIQ